MELESWPNDLLFKTTFWHYIQQHIWQIFHILVVAYGITAAYSPVRLVYVHICFFSLNLAGAAYIQVRLIVRKIRY